MNLQSKLESLFQTLFPEENLDFSKNLDSAKIQNWDSIKYVTIVLAVEEEFDIKLTQDEILEFSSFDRIFQILRSRGL
jgi:acyl carrier protein